MNDTTETKIKEKKFFQRIWADPVLSKVISVIIVALLTILYSFIVSIFEKISFKEALINTLNFKIEVYKFLIFAIISILIFVIYYYWRKKRKKTFGNFDIEQKVGNFTFRELYNALLTYKIKTEYEVPEKDELDILNLFIIYQRPLNMGVDWESQDFLYYKLGPLLMSYGLTEKISTTNKTDPTESEMIQTSKIGYEFLALLERWRVYNDSISYEKEIKTNKKN